MRRRRKGRERKRDLDLPLQWIHPVFGLYLSVLWECNRCNEHVYVLADALNSHSGRAITYVRNAILTSLTRIAFVSSARPLVKLISLCWSRNRCIPAKSKRSLIVRHGSERYALPMSTLICFYDCSAYSKRSLLGLYNDRQSKPHRFRVFTYRKLSRSELVSSYPRASFLCWIINYNYLNRNGERR